ncbi:hypothetical protein V3C99_013272 [Haemonchus contortus]
MEVTRESRKKERRKRRDGLESRALKNVRRGITRDNLHTKYTNIVPSGFEDKSDSSDNNSGVVRSCPSSPKIEPLSEVSNGSDVRECTSPSTLTVKCNSSPKEDSDQTSREPSSEKFENACSEKIETVETVPSPASNSNEAKRGRVDSPNPASPSIPCTGKAKQSRRSLPKVGTKERKEILAEDAKRRLRDSANRHTCPHCSYSAPFPNKIKRHINNKHSESHSCSKCGKRFNDFVELRAHVAAVHPAAHRCKFCQFSSKVLAEVRKHTLANHEKGIVCTVAGCNMRVARWHLKHHLRTVHLERLPAESPRDVRSTLAPSEETSCFTCSQCDFITSELEDFNSHLMNVHEKGILCPMPDCTIHVLLGDLDNHLRSFHEQCDVNLLEELDGDRELEETSCSSVPKSEHKRLASCTTASVSECASTSDISEDLPSDCEEYKDFKKPSFTKLKSNGVGMQCALCGKHYRNSYLLKKHIKRVHDKAYTEYRRTRKYFCYWEGCGKAFRTSGLLDDHLNHHKGVTPYCCKSCNVSFAARARFAVHLSKYHRMSIRDYTNVSALLGPSKVSNSAVS